MQLYDKVFAGLRSAALAKLLTQLLSWVGMVYTVRQLDSHAFGTFGLAAVVLSYAAMVYEGGVLEALIQHPPESEHERRSLFTVMGGSALALTGLLMLCAHPISRVFADEAVGSVLMLLALTLLLTALSMLPLADLMRRMHFQLLAFISSAQAVAATLTTVVLARGGYGVWSLAWGAIAGSLVRMVLLNVNSNGWQWPTLRLGTVGRYARFAGTLALDNVLFRWYTTVDAVFLGRWAGTATLGYYTLAQDMANMPLEKVASVVNDVSLPAYSALQSNPERAAHLMLETVRTHATIGFPMFWGMAAVASTAVPLLFGDKWNLAVVPLAALAFVAPFRLIGSVETPLLTGLGRPDVLLKTKLVLVPCMTVALAVGCKLGGLVGASLVWALVFPLVYTLCFRWALSQVRIPFGQVFRAVSGPCVAAGFMSLAALGADWLVRSQGGFVISRLCVAIVVGVLAYAALLWTLDRHAFDLVRARVLRVTGLAAPVSID